MNKNIEDQLLTLSQAERDYVQKILKEFEEEGISKSYSKLITDDYKEVPVDIETFVTDDNYLGRAWKDSSGNLKLYPFWLDILKQLFPDNVTTSVNTFIESGARGLGKSEIAAGIVFPYLMYRVMCMKDPLSFYKLKPTEKICFAFMNIKLALAEEIAVDKFQKTIQRSPWFMSQGKMTSRNNADYWVPPEPISVIIGSQSSDLIGKPIYACFCDEISFIRNMDIDRQKEIAIDMVNTALGGMQTRFISNGKNPTLMVLASSKRSDKSFLEEHMRNKAEQDGDNVLIVDKPVWEVKPKGTYQERTFKVAVGNKFLESVVIPPEDEDNEEDYVLRGYQILNVPYDFKPNFLQDIDRALCDYAGISSSELSKYISGVMVNNCIKEERKNAFTKDILEIGNDPNDKVQYYDFFDINAIPYRLRDKPLYIHLDMSISGDMTGIAGTFIDGKKPSTDNNFSKDLYYSLGFSVSIKAPKGRQVSFEKNRNFIRWLREQGFRIKEISADTFQSYDLLQQLSAEGFKTAVLSVDRVDTDRICKPYQAFKSAIYETRFEMYYSRELVDEIINLERNINSGKIDHPVAFRKDVADAVCGSMFTASKHAEEYAFEYGESIDIMEQVNVDQEERTKEAITMNFEDMLKGTQLFTSNTESTPGIIPSTHTPTYDESAMYAAQGILVW